jgi:hypothetical protein
MSFKALSVYDTVHCNWKWGGERSFSLRGTLDVKDTYLMIFGHNQDAEKDYFLKHFKGKILHISKRAVNMAENHGTHPRNTLVVFEVEQPNQPWGKENT